MREANRLNKKWNVNAAHAYYRSNGTWYHTLKRFPGAYFDSNGYLLFKTESDYLSARAGEGFYGQKDVAIPKGISQIPGYVRVVHDEINTDDADSSEVESDEEIDVDDTDLSEGELDEAILQKRLRFQNIPTSDQLVLTRRRKGQARLRELALQNYSRRCALCDISDTSLLVASHIVRWSDDIDARGDLANIICLCYFHDTLFERGYITFTDDLQVVKKSSKSKTISYLLVLADELRLPIEVLPSPIYLKRHRERTR